MEKAVIKVSAETLTDLEGLKRVFGARSIDEVIRTLRRKARAEAARRVLGADRGRVMGFGEADRWEDRD